jgi:AraC-like DNA-binding protein
MIAAALSPELARVFAARLPAEFSECIRPISVHEREWWTSIPAGALLILDPTVLAGDGVALAMAGAAITAVGARVVLYTSFSAESMRAVAFAAPLMPVELWITGIDDHAEEFGRRVQRLAAHGLVGDVVPRLLSNSAELPRSVQAAIVALFTTPERFFEAADLARVAMTSRRNLDRSLVESGLGTARRLIVAARMLHGIARFGGPDTARSVRSVADSLGYSDPEVFSRHFAEVFGIRPAARASLHDSRILSCILGYIKSTGDSIPAGFSEDQPATIRVEKDAGSAGGRASRPSVPYLLA